MGYSVYFKKENLCIPLNPVLKKNGFFSILKIEEKSGYYRVGHLKVEDTE